MNVCSPCGYTSRMVTIDNRAVDHLPEPMAEYLEGLVRHVHMHKAHHPRLKHRR
jgi:hypothetical protein